LVRRRQNAEGLVGDWDRVTAKFATKIFKNKAVP
jgi:hypothetical protein